METRSDPRAVIERLCRERREDYANLSRLIGRNSTYIQQFIRRGSPRKLSEGDRRTLARYFGIDETDLGGPSSPVSPVEAAGLMGIPMLNVGVSAGHGALDQEESLADANAFGPKWLKRICGSPPDKLSIVHVEGDSMYPTLAHGDDIMVDHSSERGRLQDGIYVLRRDDTLVVKRLAIHPATKRVTITSDNPAYPSLPDCLLKDIDVIGRVVWAGRKIA